MCEHRAEGIGNYTVPWLAMIPVLTAFRTAVRPPHIDRVLCSSREFDVTLRWFAR